MTLGKCQRERPGTDLLLLARRVSIHRLDRAECPAKSIQCLRDGRTEELCKRAKLGMRFTILPLKAQAQPGDQGDDFGFIIISRRLEHVEQHCLHELREMQNIAMACQILD